MYKSKNGSAKVIQVNLTHTNHPVNEATYHFNKDDLNEDERDLVMTLKEANTKTSQIKRMLSQEVRQTYAYTIKNLIKCDHMYNMRNAHLCCRATLHSNLHQAYPK